MTVCYFKKMVNGTLAPEDASTIEWLAKIKSGDVVGGEFKRKRNYRFHKKWFALIQYAFEHWEPAADLPEKNFKRFRQEVTMLAGYYHEVPSIRGGIRYEADSISFSSMGEETFTKLYDATVTALIKWVLKGYKQDDVERVVQGILEFSG